MGVAIGLLNVRRSILIDAPPQRVWQEFATPERLAAWFGQGHTLHVFETRLGGKAELSVEIDGQPRQYGGRVIAFEPERELSAEINWAPPHDWPVPMFWTIRLTPLYDGTLVELFHHGFERLGRAAADNLEGYEEGWTVRHLKSLRKAAEAGR